MDPTSDVREDSALSSVVYVQPTNENLNLNSSDNDEITYLILPSDDNETRNDLSDPFTHDNIEPLTNFDSQMSPHFDDPSLKDLGTLKNDAETSGDKSVPTFVEILVETDEFLKKNHEKRSTDDGCTDRVGRNSKEKMESAMPQPDLALDNPIAINEQSIVVVDGKKCVLRLNQETGQLYAYPTKTPKRGRGRPRKNDIKNHLVETETSSHIEELHNNLSSDDVLDELNVKVQEGRSDQLVKRKRGMSRKLPNNVITPVLPAKPGCSELQQLKCELCGHQSYFQFQKHDHLVAAHPDQIVRCVVCNFVAFTNEELVKHYLDYHPQNYCQYCGLTNEKSFIIKRHMMRHTREGCECPICGKVFKDSYIKEMHVKMLHLPANTIYECSICQKKFNRRSHLTRHIKIHEADKAFKCPFCDYRGIEKADVSKHLRVHEEPTFFCEICTKLFRHSKNRDLHVKRHKQQKDYKCGLCDFYGYTLTDIRKHIERTHSENSRLLCEKCSASFKSLEEYTQHQQSCVKNSDVEGESGVQSSGVQSSSEDNMTIRSLMHDKDMDLSGEDTTRNLVMDGEHFMPDDHWTIGDVTSAHAPQSFVSADNGYHQILADDEVPSDAASHMDIQT